jgi:hypothetical protein
VLQAIEIVSQAEQQSLATLGEQTAARRAAGEFAFGHREHGFDQGTTAVEATGKVVSHFGADAVDAPGFLAAFGGNDAAG